jgi:hypothetical protein
MKIKSKIINTPKFSTNKSKKMSSINEDVKEKNEQNSNTSSENFSFRLDQHNQYNNHSYYEIHHTSSQKGSEMSEKYSINEKIQRHTTRDKEKINHRMLNKRDEININNIILRNINAKKKTEYKSDLMNINHKTDLNKPAINSIQEKMLGPKFIKKIKKKSSSKSQKKKKLKLNNIKNSFSSYISKSNIAIHSLNSKEKQIINQVISNKNSISNDTSKYQSNIITPLNVKNSTENNSAKSSLYGSIRKNEYRPSFSVISAEKIHGLTLNEKMDIYLDNQYSLNQSIEKYMKKQDDYMKKQDDYMKKQDDYMKNQDDYMKNQDDYMKNQKDIYTALFRNLQQISGDVKDLKKKI